MLIYFHFSRFEPIKYAEILILLLCLDPRGPLNLDPIKLLKELVVRVRQLVGSLRQLVVNVFKIVKCAS